MRNHSYENDFDLRENETAYRAHFHMKGLHLDSFGNRRTRELGNGLLWMDFPWEKMFTSSERGSELCSCIRLKYSLREYYLCCKP